MGYLDYAGLSHFYDKLKGEKGQPNGFAGLDASGKVPQSQLPSYVDDVIEGYLHNGKFYSDSAHTTEILGESSKIYIDISSEKTYRWSGTVFVEISESLALGETSSTAYRGDRGKVAYEHATDSNKISTAKTEALYKVAVTSEGHIESASAVQKQDITALGIPGQDTTYNDMTGATAQAAGTSGLVPAPSAGDENKFLKGDGSWDEVPNPQTMQGATAIADGEEGLVPAPEAGEQNKFLKGDGTWATTPYPSNMTGATSSSSGTAGLVPAPAQGDQTKFLKGDGSWDDVPDPQTMQGASASSDGEGGLVPQPLQGDQNMYLKGDGTWDTPAGSKLIVVNLDTVTNTSGAYTHTTSITGVTADMKPVMLEASDIGIFDEDVEVTTAANAVTLTCSNVSGTSTVKVSLMVYGDAAAGSSAVTSEEFDILATRIQNAKTPFTGATSSTAGTSGMVPAPSAGDEDKVLKGDGTWGTAGLDPSDIANNVTTTESGKVLDARQGKVLNDKLVPFTGATAQAAGSAGFVPAPATTAMKKFLCGDGTWADAEGGKLIVFDLDTVTNSGGSYTHTTTLANVTHDMKVVLIETDDPTVFGATVNVSTADGSITLSCDEVNGTAEVTVSCMFVANADPLTSSEFDVLSNRIGSLSALTTTDKSSVVGAINELNASFAIVTDTAGAKNSTVVVPYPTGFSVTNSSIISIHFQISNHNTVPFRRYSNGDIFEYMATDNGISVTNLSESYVGAIIKIVLKRST